MASLSFPLAQEGTAAVSVQAMHSTGQSELHARRFSRSSVPNRCITAIGLTHLDSSPRLCSCNIPSPGLVMADSSDGAGWRRSFSEMVSSGGAALAPLRRGLIALLSTLQDNAQAVFARHFDGGYDPRLSEEPDPRGEGAIAVRNLS